MSQCFKLVNGGFVDKVIVFDSLPERLYKNVKTRAADGFPRAWAKWLAEIGSLRTVFATETNVDLARNWTFKHTPIGKEPCFFVLDYQDLNQDKEAWRLICEYLRQHVGPEVRLKEKIEDMAIVLAPNSNTALAVEPEDVPVVPVPNEVPQEKPAELVSQGETIIVKESAHKRPGRPKKVVVEA
jgi:hypothetical protein